MTDLVTDIPGFPERLRGYREQAGLTQHDLALKLGLRAHGRDGGSVAQWEGGRCYPRLPVFRELCRVLKVKADDLLSE